MILIRYGVIQLFAYALDMGVFLLLHYALKDQPFLANVISKGGSGVFSFFLHRHFTFQSTEGSGRVQALRYFAVLSLNIPIASALFAAALYFIDNPALMKFASDLACVALTYWVSKFFIFRTSKKTPSPVDHAKDI